MVRNIAFILMLQIITLLPCHPQVNTTETSAPPMLEKMPEALETRFALSAAPPHLRDNATVYFLDPAKGYVMARHGTNGASCIVVRSDWQWSSPPFRDDVYWPRLLRL